LVNGVPMKFAPAELEEYISATQLEERIKEIGQNIDYSTKNTRNRLERKDIDIGGVRLAKEEVRRKEYEG